MRSVLPGPISHYARPKAIAVQPVTAQQRAIRVSNASMASVTQYTESTEALQPSWLAELLNDPDPQVRLQGLDAWKRHPSETLDAVAYALVDPDESVRDRAQVLFEEALARR